MDEIHATIGRVQLKKLPEIIQKRRALTQAVTKKIKQAGLKAVRLVEEPADTQGVYWFWLFCSDLEQLKVDKTAFADALVAEGIPAVASYRPMPTLAQWYRQRKVFGSSGYPWASPLYGVQETPSYEFPNILSTDANHFRVSFHEGWEEQEIEDLTTALTKVERAYRQE